VDVAARTPTADAAEVGDADLLSASARGDAQAFRALVDRHFSSVYRMAWRVMGIQADAEDIAQEAFVKLWQKPDQVKEPRALKGWLMRVASNAAIDRMRRKGYGAVELDDDIADERRPESTSVDSEAARTRVDGAIAALPDRQRLALTLVYFEGLGNMGAAEIMEISVDAVESLLARAKRALRESLAGDWRELLDELNAEG
jgi:RNA polymerase sigma-70 factor, ECF subfamily